MKTSDLIAASIAVLLALPFGLTCLADEPKQEDAAAKSEPEAARPKITISKETTYITEPLRADGYPDYLAAINHRCSAGVTPENNAAIPFWQAVGPKNIDKKIRKQYFKLLGIPELPEDGEYLVSFDDFFQHTKGWKNRYGDTPKDEALAEEAQTQAFQAHSHPWSKEDHPVLAALLEKNEKALQIFVDAAQRPRFYSPLVAKEGESFEQCGVIHFGEGLREAAHQLAQRAMLRLNQGRVAEARKDTLACHRWARLLYQGPFLTHGLLAVTCENISLLPTVALAQSRATTAEQVQQWQSDLRKLSARSTMRESLDYGERLLDLGRMTDIALHGHQPRNILLYATDARIDWDETLSYCNAWIDRIVSVCDKPTYAQRREAMDRIKSEADKLAQQAMEQASKDGPLSPDLTPKKIAWQLVDVLMGLDWGAAGVVLEAETKLQANSNLVYLTLALTAYRHDHSSYPKTLSELSPKYIAEIPKDPFTDGDLHYKPEGDSYLLYSVGPNGVDDGGRNYWEEFAEICRSGRATTKEDESYDDIAIRTPPKQNEKK